MSQLEKIVKLTKAQYETLITSTNHTISYAGGTHTYSDNNLYFITDETVSANDLGENFLLDVLHGGTGKDSFTVGSVLVGNGTAALTELAATSLNIANTIIKRDADGNFITGSATIGNTLINAKKLEPLNQINADGANLLLGYKISGTGTTTGKWTVGTVDIPGVIRSNNSDLEHSRAGSNSVILDAGNYSAYPAYSLRCKDRPSTANSAHNSTDYGKIYAFLSSSNMNNSGVKPLFTGTTAAPTALDGYILDFHWDNSGQFNPQIAVNNGGKSLSIRGNVSGTWSEWVPILTRDTIGPGDANGQIKVAGNNVNITGLQALAYKDSLTISDIPNHGLHVPTLQTSNQMTYFLRGDNNWSDTLTSGIKISNAAGTNNLTGITVENTSVPHSIGLRIGGTTGSGGLVDITNNKWIVYSDTSGNVTLNGTADKANKDGSGNTITDTYAPLASPSFTGTVTVPTPSNSTDAATKAYVDGILAANDALVYKGIKNGANASTNGGTLLPSGVQGDTYKVATSGYINGIYCELGDMIICVTDVVESTSSNYTTTINSWNIIQTSDGTVSTSETSVTENTIPIYSGTTGKFIKKSGVKIDDTNHNLIITGKTASATTGANAAYNEALKGPKLIFADDTQSAYFIGDRFDGTTDNKFGYTIGLVTSVAAGAVFQTDGIKATSKLVVGTTFDDTYTFKVSGNSHLNGDTTINGNLIFSKTNTKYIDWNNQTYRQRIQIEDNSTANDEVFIFSQSSDSGVNYTDLFTIKDNGTVVADTFSGDLSGNADTASHLNSDNNIYTAGLQYYSGQPTIGTLDGNAAEGSNANYNLWSYPANGTTTTTVANIQSIRAYWNASYMHEIFISPNKEEMWHRAITNNTANDWRKFLDSENTYAESSGTITVTCGSDTTLATINGTAIKINVNTPSYSDVGAAASDHTHSILIATDTATNALALNYGQTYKITAGGSSYSFTMPSIGTTDSTAMAGNTVVTNVSYTSTSDNAEYPILIKNSTGTTTTAGGVKFNSGVTINPSTKIITALGIRGATVKIQTVADNTVYTVAEFDGMSILPGTSSVYTNRTLGNSTRKWQEIYATDIYTNTLSTGTVTSPTDTILYLNSPSNTSIIFTRGGANTSSEMARFDTDKNFVPKSTLTNTIGTSSINWTSMFSKQFVVESKVVLQWNNTDQSLDFIFV